MRALIWIDYYGEVSIAYWEWIFAFIYVIVFFLYYGRIKSRHIKKHPEYRFLLWGLSAKFLGAVFFSLIYFYYYNGGDTTAYFYSALPIKKLAFLDFDEYWRQMMGDNSMRAWMSYDPGSPKPYGYVFLEDRTFTLLRIISVCTFFTFDSYLITTLLVASLSYTGAWACYRTFVRYYPSLDGKLAVAFLFMPSVLFWGSGIMKDTLAFSGMCWFIHAVDNIFHQKTQRLKNWIVLSLASVVMLAMKPYILMLILPACALWVTYHRIARIRSAVIRFVLVPAALAGLYFANLYILEKLGDRLEKFSLDSALDTIVTVQGDMKRKDAYSSNYFDLGTMDGSWSGMLAKSPAAIFAALFRPTLLEARSAVMIFAALEGAWLLLLSLRVLFASRIMLLVQLLRVNPLLQMCLVFSLGFAFTVGISTPNFGALVRFKIPLIPLYVSAMFITLHIMRARSRSVAQGIPFRLVAFADGEPQAARTTSPAGGYRRQPK